MSSRRTSHWLGVGGRPTILRIGCCIGSTSTFMGASYSSWQEWSTLERLSGCRAKGKRQKAKGERQKAKGKRRRQKAKGKRRKAKGERQKAKAKGKRQKAKGKRRTFESFDLCLSTFAFPGQVLPCGREFVAIRVCRSGHRAVLFRARKSW